MKKFIKWNEEWIYVLTNMQVDNLKKQLDTWRSWELVKVMYEHIEVYRTVIDNLLEKQWEK